MQAKHKQPFSASSFKVENAQTIALGVALVLTISCSSAAELK
jgi:hypothetical protein